MPSLLTLRPLQRTAVGRLIARPLSFFFPKVGSADEVGDLIAFLLSDKSGFITGECIAIDGGRQCLGAR